MQSRRVSRSSLPTLNGVGERLGLVAGSGFAAAASLFSFLHIIINGGWDKNGSRDTCADLRDTVDMTVPGGCTFHFFPLGVELRTRTGELYAGQTSWWLTLSLLIPFVLVVAATVLAWLGLAPERAQFWVLGRSRVARVGLLATGTVLIVGACGLALALVVTLYIASSMF